MKKYCPVCKEILNDIDSCSKCGYDASLDYVRYPTLQPLTEHNSKSFKHSWVESEIYNDAKEIQTDLDETENQIKKYPSKRKNGIVFAIPVAFILIGIVFVIIFPKNSDSNINPNTYSDTSSDVDTNTNIDSNSDKYSNTNTYYRVYDYACVLSDEEERKLSLLIQECEEKCKGNIVLVTIDQQVGEDEETWVKAMAQMADDFYDQHILVDNKLYEDGALLLDNWYHFGLDNSQAGCWLSTYGKFEDIIDSKKENVIMEEMDEGFNTSNYEAYARAINQIALYGQ